MISSKAAIGIFDSGFGGLTVMRAIRKRLPHENIVYLGDTARLPYGNKSAETILRYSLENAQFLANQEIKLLVVACNTSCCTALPQMRQAISMPIIGINQGAIADVSRRFPRGKIAILGTQATIASNVYQKELLSHNPQLEIFPIPCPLFVPLVEEGLTNHPITSLAIREYLNPLQSTELDGALLCCTHYPLLMEPLSHEFGSKVHIIDPAIACAEKVEETLREHDLLNEVGEPSRFTFFVSDDPQKFQRHGNLFLGEPIEHVQTY